MPFYINLPAILISLLFFISCSTSKVLTEEKLYPVDASIEEIVSTIPNYRGNLNAAKGRGRAIVSDPGNSDRITISFDTDTSYSLLTFKNRIGIVGGSVLVDPDSILIYNKIDDIAQKLSIKDARRTSLNELVALNLLDLLNFKVYADQVQAIQQSSDYYVLTLKSFGQIRIQKENGTIIQVDQPPYSGLSYSSIRYEGYTSYQGYTLPRKITILSTDKSSKVVFQLLSLDVNPENLNLSLQIPTNISIERL